VGYDLYSFVSLIDSTCDLVGIARHNTVLVHFNTRYLLNNLLILLLPLAILCFLCNFSRSTCFIMIPGFLLITKI
jgi:hypothetical protein